MIEFGANAVTEEFVGVKLNFIDSLTFTELSLQLAEVLPRLSPVFLLVLDFFNSLLSCIL